MSSPTCAWNARGLSTGWRPGPGPDDKGLEAAGLALISSGHALLRCQSRPGDRSRQPLRGAAWEGVERTGNGRIPACESIAAGLDHVAILLDASRVRRSESGAAARIADRYARDEQSATSRTTAAPNDRARLARRRPVRPADGRRPPVRRTPDRPDAGTIGSVLGIRPLLACGMGCRAQRQSRSPARDHRRGRSACRSGARALRRRPASGDRGGDTALPCVSGSLAGARRDDGRRAARRARLRAPDTRRAASVSRRRAGCRSDSRADPRPRARIDA